MVRVRFALSAVLLAAAAALIPTGVAHALPTHPANGCNVNDLGLICIDTTGGGTFVGSVSASLASDVPLPGVTCNKEFKIYGTFADGQVFERRAQPGCGLYRVHSQFVLNRNLHSGTALCAAVRPLDHNVFNPGNACVMVQA
jgi:hypothetical protein